MTRRASRGVGAPAGIRRMAVLTALAFGCTTVRVPASTIPPTVPVRGPIADPQVELWLESGREVSPAESAEATAQAKDALRSALAGVSAPQGDTVLVVRSQGVARTASRRMDQHAAIAGLVVGAVVIVAAVVAIAVASNGKGGAPKVSLAKAVPHHVAAPRVAVPRVPVPAFRPAGHATPVVGPPDVDVNVLVRLEVPEPPPQPAAGPAPLADEGAEAWAQAALAAPPEDLVELALPPPRPLDVDGRGFFAGDRVRLELFVVDRRSGVPLWTQAVEDDVDPRDARAVQRLLLRALENERGWTAATWDGPAVEAR